MTLNTVSKQFYTGTCPPTESPHNYCIHMSGRASNRSASNNDLLKQSNRLKFDDRTFSAAGTCVWNRLLTELKAITDTRVFSRKLKSLFS